VKTRVKVARRPTISFFSSAPSNATAFYVGYQETLEAIESAKKGKLNEILTTQMALLSTRLWEHFDVYLYHNGKKLWLREGENEATDRHLRPGHHLLNLFMSGEFD